MFELDQLEEMLYGIQLNGNKEKNTIFFKIANKMETSKVYLCRVERSKINGNYTVWLPEQPDDDFVYRLVDKYDLLQGELWEILLKTGAKDSNFDVSKVYFAPEGDVFVSYTSDYELSKNMEKMLNELILNPEYFTKLVHLSGFKL